MSEKACWMCARTQILLVPSSIDGELVCHGCEVYRLGDKHVEAAERHFEATRDLERASSALANAISIAKKHGEDF